MKGKPKRPEILSSYRNIKPTFVTCPQCKAPVFHGVDLSELANDSLPEELYACGCAALEVSKGLELTPENWLAKIKQYALSPAPVDPKETPKAGPSQAPQYTIHPIALKFPKLPPEEYAELKESIRKYGQFTPIVVSEGQVLDGRHRYQICVELGIEQKTIDFADHQANAKNKLTVEEFIFDSNVKRRHLTTGQRAAIAAEFANMRQGERTDLTPSDNCLKVSQEKAAELLKVNAKSVGRAKKVKDKDPETFAKVKAGEVSLNTAVQTVEAVHGQKPSPGEQARFSRLEAIIQQGLPQALSVMEAVDEKGSIVNIAEDNKSTKGRKGVIEQWSNACEAASAAIEELIALQADFQLELDELSERQQESEKGESLSAICELALEDALSTITEAAEVELP